MTSSKKILPVKVNTDLSAAYFDIFTARYLKNVILNENSTDAYSGIKEGNNAASLKKLQSNELYVPFSLPQGNNYCIGAKGFAVTNEVYCFIYNSNNNHSIYRVNGNNRTSDLVYRSPDLLFKLSPEYFIASIILLPVRLTDPDTNVIVTKRDLYWVDGAENAGYLRVDDAIGSSGFNSTLFPYFAGNYDTKALVRVGFDVPDYEIGITEIPATAADVTIPNQLLFNGFQFRILQTNVFGVPSEHGIISDLYISGKNDCMSSNSSPRCLSLTFDAGTPFTNSIDIEYRYGNSTQWYKDNTLFLYDGSTVGTWWQRRRSREVVYNSSTNQITYTFCNNGEKTPISTDETNRVENPIPKAPQVLFELNQKLASANNDYGFSPFKKTALENCNISIISTPTNSVDTRTITIYIPIWNELRKTYQSVFKDPDGVSGYLFGDLSLGAAREAHQYFANRYQSGFIVYLNDGDSVITTQVYLDANGNLIDDPDHKGYNLSPFNFTMQKAVFRDKRPANYIARIASHLCDVSVTPNYQATSTTVWGLCNYSHSGTSYNIDTLGRLHSQELLINTCASNYDTLLQTQILAILDLSDRTTNEKVTVGYINETKQTGVPQLPMELISVSAGNAVTSVITDHNGFYYFFTRGTGRTCQFTVLSNCEAVTFSKDQDNSRYRELNITVDEAIPGYSSKLCNRVLVQGRVLLNGSNVGVPNISVVMTNGGYTTTNDDGRFSLVCHDNMSNANRAARLIVGGSGCYFTGINGTCIDTVPLTIFRCVGACLERIYLLSTILLEYQVFKSLLSGGKYSFALIGHDGKRVSKAQPIGTYLVPSIIQSASINTYEPLLTLVNNVTFSPEFKYLTVAVTKELTIEDYFTWIVDKVEFVDNTGAINSYSPSQIRIWYASLNQFNSANNYNTTTGWSFVSDVTGKPQVGDRVSFLINSGGVYFTKDISALVKYDTIGQYFLIDYTNELKALLPNALIRVYRPKPTNDTENVTYFEIPNSRIDLVNGVPQKTSVLLNTYDTYFLSRQIPVPTQLNTTPIVTTVETVNTSGAVTTKQIETFNSTNTIVSLKNFSFRFESKSPSNIWGKNINNVGRVYSKDEYEQVLHKINQVAVTGSISVNGVLNYMQYYSELLTNDFDVKNTLGISGAVADVGVVFFLTQYDNFRVGYDDNLLRVDGNGNVAIASGSSIWGKPERRVGENFGCQLKDKNSIQTYGGMTMFVDRKRCEVLQYNFSSFKSLTKDETLLFPTVPKGKIDSTFRAKLKAIASDSTKYFVGGINPLTGKYLLTDFSLANISYINQDRQPSQYANDTVLFDINTGDVSGYASFTPEMFAWLDGDILNKQLFTFNGGQPYSHNNIFSNISFNNFYGIQCESVIEIVCAGQPLSQMFFLALSNHCKQTLLFADRIITQVQQQSYLLKQEFKWSQFFSSAAFLRDTATLTDTNTTPTVLNSLISEGNPLYGQWIQIRLISDTDYNNSYMEYFGSEVSFFESERSPILERGQAGI